MKKLFFINIFLLLTACSAPPPPADPDHEARHYREWQDGGGWQPDYHDK